MRTTRSRVTRVQLSGEDSGLTMRAFYMLCSLLCFVLHVSTEKRQGIIVPDKIVLRVGSRISTHCFLLFTTPPTLDAEPCNASYIYWSLNGTRLSAAAHRPLNATISELLVDTSPGGAVKGAAVLFPGRAMLTCTVDCPFRGLQTLHGIYVFAGYPPWKPRGLHCESEGVNGNMTCSWEAGGKTFLTTTHTLQYREYGNKPNMPWKHCTATSTAASMACTIARAQLIFTWMYDFRVVATNELGHAESAIITTSHLQTVKTDAPVWQDPTFVEEQPDQATLHWKPPPNGDYASYFPLKYEMWVTSHVDGTITKYLNIQTNFVSYSLFNLRPYSNYSAHIRCTFDANANAKHVQVVAQPTTPPPVWSEWSSPLNFSTPEAAPAVAPELWRIPREPDKLGNQVTTLVWKALDKLLARGEILEYRLVCTHADKTKLGNCMEAGNFTQEGDEHEGGGDDKGQECLSSVQRLDAKRRSLTVRTNTLLGAGGAHVHLWVCNSAGASPVAYIHIGKRTMKPEGGLLREPLLTLDVKSIGDTRLVVTWQWLPKVAKRLLGWVLQVCHPCEEACTKPRWWRLPAITRTAPIDSLVRGQCCMVSLSPIMVDGSVGSAVTKWAYSAEEAPSASPNELTVKEGKTSALVSWKPLRPADQRGFINYTISIRSPGDKPSVVQVSGHQTEVLLPDLRSSSKYTVNVYAFNSAGKGPRSTDYVFSTLVYDVGELETIVVTASLLGLFLLGFILLMWGKVQGRVKNMIWPHIASPDNSKAVKSLINDKQVSSEPASPVSQNSLEEEFCTNIEELGKKCLPEQTSISKSRSSGSGSGDDEPYSSISLIDHGSTVTHPAPATPVLSLSPPPPHSVRRYINIVAPSYTNVIGGDRQQQAAREQAGSSDSQQRENEFGGSGNDDVGAEYGRSGIFSGGGGDSTGKGRVGVSNNGGDGGDVFGVGGRVGCQDTRHVELFVDLEKISLLHSSTVESPTEPDVVMNYLPQSVKDPGYMPQ